jgi:hypothetical protein
MTDNTELKRLAEAATAGPWSMCGEADGSQGFEIIQDIWNEHGTHTGKDVVVYEWSDESDPLGVIHRADAEFIAAANPVAVLALIADLDEARNGMKHSCAIRLKKRIELLETQRDQLIADNERLTKAVGLQVIRRFVGDDDQKNIDELVAAGIQVDKELIVQLKAENERLTGCIVQRRAQAEQYDQALIKMAAERDRLSAEVAGLRTGYEAYERVNAELKAEVGALRQIISDSATSCGAAVSVECTLDFMKHLPVEIFSVISKLRNALAECADSLHGEMLQKFGGQLPDDMHPVTRREYDRDMAEVAGYRVALGRGEQS